MTTIFQLAAIALGFGLLERLPALRFERLPFLRRGFGTDLLHLAVTSAITSATLAWVTLGSNALGAFGVPRLASLGLPSWAFVPIALALLDLGQTLVHRALHRFDPLWELHKVHHSSPSLDWLATFRAHGLEHVLRTALAPLGLIVLGLPGGAVAIAAALHGILSIANHSNLSLAKLRWLEPVFVTPRLHRVHHVSRTSETNFAVVFTLWDRLLGSFEGRMDVTPGSVLGVPGEEASYPQHWPQQLVEPLRRWASFEEPRAASPRGARAQRATLAGPLASRDSSEPA